MSGFEFKTAPGGVASLPAREQTNGEPQINPDVVASSASPLAQRLRAKLEQAPHRRRRFPVPPRDVWGNGLVMVAKPCSIEAGATAAAIIADATEQILFDDGDGNLVPIESVPEAQGRGGWEGIAYVAGLVNPDGPPLSVGEIITRVCTSRDVLAMFGDDVASWVVGRRSVAEQFLGE